MPPTQAKSSRCFSPMASDCPPGQPSEPGTNTSLAIGLDDADEAERIFAKLSEGGTVTMPIQETFWASRFGVVADQFGIPWEINCGRATPNALT